MSRGDWRAALQLARSAGSRHSAGSAGFWQYRILEARSLVYSQDWAGAARLVESALPESEALCSARAWQAWIRGIAAQRTARDRAAGLFAEAEALGRDCGDREAVIEATQQLAMAAPDPAGKERLLGIALREAIDAQDDVQRMYVLRNLSVLYLEQRRADEGLAAAEQAREIARSLGDRLAEAKAAFNIASFHGDLGDFDSAVREVRQLLPLLRESSRPLHMAALGQLGLFLSQRGDGAEAVEPLREALVIARELGSHNDKRRYATNLSTVLIGLGRVEEAAEASDEADRTFAERPDLPGREYAGINRARIALARGATQLAETELRAVAALPSLPPRLRWETEFRLAQVYRRLRKPDESFRHYEAALALGEAARAAQGREESRISFLNTLAAFYAEYSDALIEAGREEAAFAVEESSRARLLSVRAAGEVRGDPRAALQALRDRARRTGAVFLAYWITPQRRHVRIVTGAGHRRADLPVDAPRLRRMVAEYRRQLEAFADPLAASETLGRELYRTLLGPVEEAIPRGARVFLAADGPLHALNFETLVAAPGSPRYWIEDATVSVVPSLSMLVESERAPASRAHGLLAVGDPVPAERGFRRLEHGAAEMRNVARHFDDRTVLEGAAATPAAFEQAGPNRFRYVHFTAHGKASVQSPLDSFVVLSPSQGRGLLRVRDVVAHPIAADLVTISSCRGAGERSFTGEGMIGFAWGFQRAGARSVIAGLWDVNDRSTPAIMDKLYESIAAGRDPAQGLRAAKLELVRGGGRYAKPFYWGPFQLYTASL